MSVILGLDVSTQCIGLTLAKEKDGKIDILQVTHFRLKISSKIKGTEGLFHKSQYFDDVLSSYKDLSRFNCDEKIDKVIIEEPLISSNNSETASTLLRFNGMISQSVYVTLGVIPEFISSYEARKYAFPDLMAVRKYNKNGEIYPLKKIRHALKNDEIVLFGGYDWNCSKKEILFYKVCELFPDINWVYNKKGELTKENFDASDSLVCVIGYVRKMLYKDYDKPHIVDYSEETHGETTLIKYHVRFCNMCFDKTIEL